MIDKEDKGRGRLALTIHWVKGSSNHALQTEMVFCKRNDLELQIEFGLFMCNSCLYSPSLRILFLPILLSFLLSSPYNELKSGGIYRGSAT